MDVLEHCKLRVVSASECRYWLRLFYGGGLKERRDPIFRVGSYNKEKYGGVGDGLILITSDDAHSMINRVTRGGIGSPIAPV